jgi:F-type H+-transporting ATPase subunit epsilon
MPATLQCEIVTPKARYFSAEASFVVVPATGGETGILPKHVPLVSTLGAGEVRVTCEGQDVPERFAIAGGYVQVQDGERVIVLADHAIKVTDIDLVALEEHIVDLEAQIAQLEQDAPQRLYLDSELSWAKQQQVIASK